MLITKVSNELQAQKLKLKKLKKNDKNQSRAFSNPIAIGLFASVCFRQLKRSGKHKGASHEKSELVSMPHSTVFKLMDEMLIEKTFADIECFK